ncbi:uncharacterized protein MEPE_06474 [Melanopsichium pennsylvanicum]|uniref:Uncharacterized protein n=1 Tax=Melanopsichium pennsylvanicum TaxID=63383 RepID=A0AAJ5C8N6_9BASI|nr:uncharacterized protein MEPE_06474 [Melanopsichium pennsylvanicum]
MRSHTFPKENGIRVVGSVRSQFSSLSDALETGMIPHSPGCVECTRKQMHCTYGAGTRHNGKSRDATTGKCDYCIFTTRKCIGKGYGGKDKHMVGAHLELLQILDKMMGQVNTCIRAWSEDKSRTVNRQVLIKKVDELQDKLSMLSKQLNETQKVKGDKVKYNPPHSSHCERLNSRRFPLDHREKQGDIDERKPTKKPRSDTCEIICGNV